MCFVDGCEDECDFVVFDYVDNVWMVVFYFVDYVYWNVGGFNGGSCIVCCYDWVVQCMQCVGYFYGLWFVVVFDCYEYGVFFGQV